jgi:hypothetical protein
MGKIVLVLAQEEVEEGLEEWESSVADRAGHHRGQCGVDAAGGRQSRVERRH